MENSLTKACSFDRSTQSSFSKPYSDNDVCARVGRSKYGSTSKRTRVSLLSCRSVSISPGGALFEFLRSFLIRKKDSNLERQWILKKDSRGFLRLVWERHVFRYLWSSFFKIFVYIFKRWVYVKFIIRSFMNYIC